MRSPNLRSGLAQLEVFHVLHLVDHFLRILTEWVVKCYPASNLLVIHFSEDGF